eukprot:CAMPEP_0117491758 /NCGR_PEP_ID=MMETSP0784-20121206/18232_1 /TAXON_ID=39447 /ORGANISM="" /LENGTH=1095 /DNA_ID=CAMNT_0005286559 /DNA_START=41 /DNA_END=3328 /DNA_ORIENTATION=-
MGKKAKGDAKADAKVDANAEQQCSVKAGTSAAASTATPAAPAPATAVPKPAAKASLFGAAATFGVFGFGRASAPSAPKAPANAVAPVLAARVAPEVAAAPEVAIAPKAVEASSRAAETSAPSKAKQVPQKSAAASAPASAKKAAKFSLQATPAPATKEEPEQTTPSPPATRAQAAASRPEEPEKEVEAMKKKKNRRAGRNKKATADVEEEQREVMPVRTGPTGAELADRAMEQDEELLALRARLATVDDAVTSRRGAQAEWRKEVEDVAAEAARVLESRKANVPKQSRQPSEKLAQSLQELEEEGLHDMAEGVRKQLEEAKAAEVYVAIKLKLNAIKARCEELLRTIAKPQGTGAPGNGRTPAGAGATDASGALGAALALEAAEQAATLEEARAKEREANLAKRLAEMHDKSVEDVKVQTKTVSVDQLGADVMKYLSVPSYGLDRRLEKEFGVVMETVRPPKGVGKGSGGKSASGKGGQMIKEVMLAGLKAEEVNKCAVTLGKLDFSGMQKKDVDCRFLQTTQQIEKECRVYMFPQRSTLTIFGTKKDVEAAFAKVEALKLESAVTTSSVQVDPDMLKAVKAKLSEWAEETGTKMWVPGGSDGSKSKVHISSKAVADVDKAILKVEEFLKQHACEFVGGDMSKLRDGASGGLLGQRYRHIRDASPEVFFNKRADGISLVGPREEVARLKADVKITAMANSEPFKVPLQPEQKNVFNRETIAMITGKTGAEVGRQEGYLIVYGDDNQIQKAKEEIEEVIQREGTFETLTVSRDVMKCLGLNKAEMIQELEDRFADVNVTLNHRMCQVVISGSAKGVQLAKNSINSFAKKKDKEIADTITKELSVDNALMKFIIGKGGETVKNIKATCKVEINVPKTDGEIGTIELKGVEEEVAKAEDMINAIVARTTRATKPDKEKEPKAAEVPAPKSKTAPPGASRKKEFKGSLADDFPTLGGDDTGPKNVKARGPAGHWGARAAATEATEEAAAAPETEAYPSLGEAPKSATVAPKQEPPQSGDFPALGAAATVVGSTAAAVAVAANGVAKAAEEATASDDGATESGEQDGDNAPERDDEGADEVKVKAEAEENDDDENDEDNE